MLALITNCLWASLIQLFILFLQHKFSDFIHTVKKQEFCFDCCLQSFFIGLFLSKIFYFCPVWPLIPSPYSSGKFTLKYISLCSVSPQHLNMTSGHKEDI